MTLWCATCASAQARAEWQSAPKEAKAKRFFESAIKTEQPQHRVMILDGVRAQSLGARSVEAALDDLGRQLREWHSAKGGV